MITDDSLSVRKLKCTYNTIRASTLQEYQIFRQVMANRAGFWSFCYTTLLNFGKPEILGNGVRQAREGRARIPASTRRPNAPLRRKQHPLRPVPGKDVDSPASKAPFGNLSGSGERWIVRNQRWFLLADDDMAHVLRGVR